MNIHKYNMEPPSNIVQRELSGRKSGKKHLPCGSESILLVEDDHLVRKMTAVMLNKLGYHIMAADSPLKAISLFRDHNQNIDLVLTDVLMPEMNGVELRNKMIELKPDIRVLFMSGYTSDVILPGEILENKTAFIPKPFNLKALAEKVRHVINLPQ